MDAQLCLTDRCDLNRPQIWTSRVVSYNRTQTTIPSLWHMSAVATTRFLDSAVLELHLQGLQFKRRTIRHAGADNHLRRSQSKYCCSNCHGGSGSHRRYSRCRKQPLLTDATERLYRKSDLYNQCNASARDTRLYHYLSTLLSKQHHIERGKFRNLG